MILLWCAYWYLNTSPIHSQPYLSLVKTDRIAMAWALAVASVIALLRAAVPGLPNGVHGVQRFLTDAAVTAISVFWVEAVLYGVIRAGNTEL